MQAKAIEQQVDEANQKAAALLQQAMTALVPAGLQTAGQPAGTKLPSTTTSLSGCRVCGFSEAASK